MSAVQTSQELSAQWLELCAQYLPVAPEGSIWRYYRASNPRASKQGWKLHISATILNAHKVLKKIAPVLMAHKVQFKAPRSLHEVSQLNSGIHYAYSQIGKVITIYPQTDQEAVRLALLLDKLTRRFAAPAVPFDNRFSPNSNVYYRYGGFAEMELEVEGNVVRAIKDPKGNLVPDLCLYGGKHPDWVRDPFPPRRRTAAVPNPLKDSFRVVRALSQRGKGGVYQAIDLTSSPPRFCLLKEGRRVGEIGWDGRDGRRRVQQEERTLSLLRERGVDVPLVYSSFQLAGHYYLVTEYIDGESLLAFLRKQSRRLSMRRVLELSIQLAEFMVQIHRAGWVWRDCKPGNLILVQGKKLRSLDFESSYPVRRRKRATWGTPGFIPKRSSSSESRSPFDDDLFALGVVIYFLITGRMPGTDISENEIQKKRRQVHAGLARLVFELLNDETRSRLSSAQVLDHLSSLGHGQGSAGRGGRSMRFASDSNRGSDRRLEKIGSSRK